MQKKLKPHIYMPIEIMVRELNSKVFFSFKASNKGYRIYLGTKKGIDRLLEEKKNNVKSGIYFNKSQLVKNRIYMKKIKKTCEHFLVLDEELGPTIFDPKDVLKERAIVPSDIDKFFLIGKSMMMNIKKFVPKFFNISKISGWIKYELYKKQYLKIFQNDVEDIKKKHKNFYLFSSNFGALSNEGLNYKISVGHVEKKTKEIKFFKRCINDFNNIKKDFNSKSRKLNIVIRPHPSDSLHKDWYNNINQNESLSIEFKNDIIPWIIASKGLIHRGCSTSVDALLLGKPVYYLKPKRKLLHSEKDLSYKISHKINALDEILLKRNLRTSNIAHHKVLAKEIHNIRNKDCADIILKEMKKFKTKNENPIKISFLRNTNSYFRYYVSLFIRLFTKHKGLDFKLSEKFDKKTIINKIRSLSDSNEISVREVAFDVFEIDKK